MQLNYELARHLEGNLIRFQNKKGEWSVGRVSKVKKNGLVIEELNSSTSDEGYGYGFWGPRFFGPPAFVPFVGFGFFAPLWF